MLKISIHAGPVAKAQRFNLVAWLDIGYEKLAPVADYKVVLFQSGLGATAPLALNKYPRWSASLWGLVARAIALGLNTISPSEVVPTLTLKRKSSAFATELCAFIEHFPGGDSNKRSTLGTLSLKQDGTKRGTYRAKFEEHTMPVYLTGMFDFKVDHLRPAELVLHACLHRLNNKAEMPPRPGLCVPSTIEVNGENYVPIHRLVEPAQSGFPLWLQRMGISPIEHAKAPLGLALESLYVSFLHKAL